MKKYAELNQEELSLVRGGCGYIFGDIWRNPQFSLPFVMLGMSLAFYFVSRALELMLRQDLQLLQLIEVHGEKYKFETTY